MGRNRGQNQKTDEAQKASQMIVENSRNATMPDLVFEEGDKGPFVVFLEKPEINILKETEKLNKLVGQENVVEVRQIGPDRLKAIFANMKAANKIIQTVKQSKKENLKAYVPAFYLTTVGVLDHIPPDIDLEDLKNEINKTNDVKVVDVQWMKMKKPEVEGLVNLDKVKIAFRSFHLPEEINYKKAILPVRIFIPKPTFCVNCLSYGHFASICKNKKRCPTCTGESIEKHNCQKFCKFCKTSDHVTNSRFCPEKSYQVKIKITMMEKRCMFKEAKFLVDKEMTLNGSIKNAGRDEKGDRGDEETTNLKKLSETYKTRLKDLTRLLNVLTKIAFSQEEGSDTRILENLRDEIDQNQGLFTSYTVK